MVTVSSGQGEPRGLCGGTSLAAEERPLLGNDRAHVGMGRLQQLAYTRCFSHVKRGAM